MKIIWSIILGLALLLQCNEGARILGIFPHPGKSHFDVFQALMEGLAAKGHTVTVVSPFPLKNPPKGYTDISLAGLENTFTNALPASIFESPTPDWLRPYSQYYWLIDMGLDTCKAVLPSPQIQNLLKSKGEYDLVLIEEFETDCFLSIPYKLNLPYIGISTCSLLPWLNTRMGNPTNPSFVNNVFTGKGGKMNFLERIQNSLVNLVTQGLYYYQFQKPAQELVSKHVGSDVPPLEDLARNTSLMLTNTHFTLHQAKPVQPAIVEIGGIHVKPAKPLEKDLEEFVAGADHGVIVFSLGSIINAAFLSEERKSIFLNVFRSMPQRVVWKIGGEIENLPKNVKTLAWLPQRDILAHPNVKAFIAHGGLLGMTEAVVSGTPFVAIPMFGDQHSNVRTAVQQGVAVELDITTINEKAVKNALETVLSEKYQKRAKELASEYLDRPVTPLDLAIYWVEYVLRHGGKPLRSPAIDLTTSQYYLLDVIGTLALVPVLIVYLIRRFIRGRKCKNSEKVKKQ